MKALTHHQTSAKRFPRVASKEDTRPTQRNGCQIAVNTQRLEDHVDTGLKQIMNMRVGCWRPPLLANMTR